MVCTMRSVYNWNSGFFIMTTGELYNYDKFGKFCVQYIREFNDLIFNTCLSVIYSLQKS